MDEKWIIFDETGKNEQKWFFQRRPCLLQKVPSPKRKYYKNLTCILFSQNRKTEFIPDRFQDIC